MTADPFGDALPESMEVMKERWLRDIKTNGAQLFVQDTLAPEVRGIVDAMIEATNTMISLKGPHDPLVRKMMGAVGAASIALHQIEGLHVFEGAPFAAYFQQMIETWGAVFTWGLEDV